MNKVFSCFALLLFSAIATAQSVIAEYDCERTYPSGTVLDYTGKYFFQNNQSLSYLVATYLDKYPNGIMKTQNGEMVFSSDSVQDMVYIDLENGYRKSVFGGKVYQHKMTPGIENWQMTGNEKEIAGFKCFNALLLSKNKPDTIADIWFTKDIAVPTSIEYAGYVPGFVVSARLPGNFTATLRRVSLVESISPEIFKREELEQ